MNNITFVIFTYNEEKRIKHIIRNLRDYWEIIIIDNASEDDTQSIAKKMWAKVYEYKNPWYVETQEELDFVKSIIKTDYMTRSFADYMRDIWLLKEVIKVTKKWEYDVISANMIQHHYWIKWLNFMSYHWVWKKHSNRPIVFKKEIISFQGIIHRNFKFDTKKKYVANISNNIHHLSQYNIGKFELAHNRYSNIEANMRFQLWEKSSFSKMFIIIFWYFIKYYFIDWAWKSWKGWFIMVMQYMFFMFNIWAKQRELENNITLKSIEKNYNIIRGEILDDKK
jgi:glycosyltransferase involved in cell wall biosynthesis